MTNRSFVPAWLRTLRDGLTRGRFLRPYRRAPRPRAWLRLEVLEDRIAPAQGKWVRPNTGGDWNTPGSWSTGSVPGSSDTAVIGSGNTVTFSSGDTSRVAGLTADGTLNVTGG